MLNTSERTAAVVGVSWTPDKSTERGLVEDARLNAAETAGSGSSSLDAQHSL